MFCRGITWFICILLAVVKATDYNDPDSNTVSDPEVIVYRLRTDSSESSTSTTEPDPAVKQADLPNLLDAGEGAIVTLVAGDTRLVAHKAVLAARSPVFAEIFAHDTLEESGGRVAIRDVEGPVLRELLVFLYSLQAPRLASMAPQLLVAADRYGVLDLKAQCEQHVAAQLSVETAADAAVLAVRHSCKSLGPAAVAFVKDHIFHVIGTQGWADAMQSQPEDLNEVIRLLVDMSETSAPSPATVDSGTTRTPTTTTVPATQPHSDHRDCSRTTAAAAALQSTSQLDDTAISLLRNLSGREMGRRLIEAAKEGAVGEVKALLEAGADVGARDEAGSTALHWAAWYGHVEVVRRLLEAGALARTKNHFWNTPLHWAAWYGYVDVVRLLLESSSADINARNRHGTTPLHLAAEHDRAEAAAALLERGANREIRNNRGKTPLEVAREYNRRQLICMLT